MRKNNQKSYSLKLRFTVFFVLFIAAVYSVVIITALQQIVAVTETFGIQLGLPIVEEAATLIDGDSFEALSKSLNPNDPYYEKTRRSLFAIKEKSRAVYLYTMAPTAPAGGSVFRYIIDGSGLSDSDADISLLGDEEDISDYIKPVRNAMKSKTYQIGSLDYSDEWGWLISVLMPILNTSGEVVGIIGCDFAPEDLFPRLRSQVIWELVIAGVFAVLGIAAYLYLVNGINRQNRHLVELKEAAEASSLALQEERDKVVAMKDKLLAEMRALMELIQVRPSVFNEFSDAAETRFARITAILGSSEISREALGEIERIVQGMADMAHQMELHTFSDKLREMDDKIKRMRAEGKISSADKAEIASDLGRIIKAKNESRLIVKKLESYRAGDIKLRNKEQGAGS
jgi:hypothetical protein